MPPKKEPKASADAAPPDPALEHSTFYAANTSPIKDDIAQLCACLVGAVRRGVCKARQHWTRERFAMREASPCPARLQKSGTGVLTKEEAGFLLCHHAASGVLAWPASAWRWCLQPRTGCRAQHACPTRAAPPRLRRPGDEKAVEVVGAGAATLCCSTLQNPAAPISERDLAASRCHLRLAVCQHARRHMAPGSWVLLSGLSLRHGGITTVTT
jgi:hypothetical protein